MHRLSSPARRTGKACKPSGYVKMFNQDAIDLQRVKGKVPLLVR